MQSAFDVEPSYQLELVGRILSPQLLEELRENPSLESLCLDSLEESSMTSMTEVMEVLQQLTSLRRLDLSDLTLKKEHIQALGSLRSLEELTLAAIDCQPGELATISSLPSVRKLTLENVPMTVSVLEKLQTLSSLRMLHFDNFDVAVDVHPTDLFRCLGEVSQLVELQLSLFDITPKQLQRLSQLPNLKMLGINGSFKEGTLQKCARILPTFPSLRGFAYSNLADDEEQKMLDALSAWSSLETLILDYSTFTSQQCENIGSFKGLRHLRLTGSTFLGGHVDFLEKLPHLKSLDLSMTKGVKSKGWKGLEAQTQLQELNLATSTAGQSVGPILRTMKSLRKLNVYGVPLSYADFRFLRDQMERVQGEFVVESTIFNLTRQEVHRFFVGVSMGGGLCYGLSERMATPWALEKGWSPEVVWITAILLGAFIGGSIALFLARRRS